MEYTIRPRPGKKGTGWEINYFNESGERKRFNVSTKRNLSREQVTEMCKAMFGNSSPVQATPSQKPVTLGQLAESYQNDKLGINVENQVVKCKKINAFLAYKSMTDITLDDLNRVKRWLYENKLARWPRPTRAQIDQCKRGTNKEMKHFRAVMEWGRKHKFISVNPFDDFDFMPTGKAKTLLMSEAEFKRFWWALPRFHEERRKGKPYSGYRLAVIIAMNTGFRRSEIMRLEWEHIDFENDRIDMGVTKNGDQVYFPLFSKLKRTLLFIKRHHNVSGLMFPFYPTYLTNGLRRALDRAGLKKIKKPVHVLRHMFITKVIKATDFRTAQLIARHHDIKSTMVYVHDELFDYTERIEKIL